MSVLTDYFRARDDQDAARVRSHAGPTAQGRDGRAPFDAIQAKSVDHAVVLGQLIALARGVEWTPTICKGRLVEQASGDGDDGPWVVALADDIRDTLADLSVEAMPDLSARWSEIEELDAWDQAALHALLVRIQALAARAREANDHLYEWCSL